MIIAMVAMVVGKTLQSMQFSFSALGFVERESFRPKLFSSFETLIWKLHQIRADESGFSQICNIYTKFIFIMDIVGPSHQTAIIRGMIEREDSWK